MDTGGSVNLKDEVTNGTRKTSGETENSFISTLVEIQVNAKMYFIFTKTDKKNSIFFSTENPLLLIRVLFKHMCGNNLAIDIESITAN